MWRARVGGRGAVAAAPGADVRHRPGRAALHHDDRRGAGPAGRRRRRRSTAPSQRSAARTRSPCSTPPRSPPTSSPAQRTGVAAAAGPFGQVVLDLTGHRRPGRRGPLTVVGRADPGRPGRPPGPLAGTLARRARRGRPQPSRRTATRTVPPDSGAGDPRRQARSPSSAGRYSLSQSADAWVTPGADDRAAAHRPRRCSTGSPVTCRRRPRSKPTWPPSRPACRRARWSPRSRTSSSRRRPPRTSASYVPFLATFGVLGLIVAIVIVGNVVSGAVVSGFRHIGILKALGFTPRQVVAVYLVMVSVPAVVGCVLGTVAGALAARPLLTRRVPRTSGSTSASASAPWVWVAGLVGMPAFVALAAFVPAVRAHRLSAAEAISAGSAPRTGRGDADPAPARRCPAAARGHPRAGPAVRATGPDRLHRRGRPARRDHRDVRDRTGRHADPDLHDRGPGVGAGRGPAVRRPDAHRRLKARPRRAAPAAVTTRTDAQVEELLRGLPDAARVTANFTLPVSTVGQTQPLTVNFVRGDYSSMGYQDRLTAGRWMARAGRGGRAVGAHA